MLRSYKSAETGPKNRRSTRELLFALPTERPAKLSSQILIRGRNDVNRIVRFSL